MNSLQSEDNEKTMGDRLIDLGIITREQLSLAQSEKRRNGGSLADILEKLEFVSQTEIARQLASDLQTEFIDLAHTTIAADVLGLIKPEIAKQYRVIPLDRDGPVLTVAMANTYDVIAIDALEKHTAMRVEVIAAAPQDILNAIEQKYSQSTSVDSLIDSILKSNNPGNESAIDQPLVQLVDQIIAQGAHKRATDIHFEPQESSFRIRFRVDGVLQEEHLLPKTIQTVIIARIKILSNLDVTEHRLPQDGKIPFKLGHKRIDLRISTLPTQYGESVVIRLLDKSKIALKLGKLGLSKEHQDVLLHSITKPHGIILATGPTGSGKTTTLYAALSQMDAIHDAIFTLEDPVEYALPYIRQTQINADIGMTFANGLRALLRQDPDVILVGEIRDEETAQLAVRAALTGHLVLSTLHTNSAAGAIPRLINMGIEPYLLNSILVAVIAQRLVRKNCPRCSEPQPELESYQQKINFEIKQKDKFKKGKGCPQCYGSGSIGRIAVYEILLNEHLQSVTLQEGITEYQIINGVKQAGMRFMIDDGIEKARTGVCSLDDLIREVGV